MSDLIVTLQHLRAVRGFSARNGYCIQGCRKWCAAHGIDWADFIRNGVSAEKLLATGDFFAIQLVEAAREAEESKHE